MAMMSIGDLSQSFFLQRRGTALKVELNRLTEELATGQVSDVKARLAGNVSYLSGIERDMMALGAYQVATTEAAQFTNAVQNALGRVQTSTGDMANAILRVGSTTVHTVVEQISSDAETELANMMSALNGQIAGRSLFAGAATNVAPLRGADALLGALRTELAGATSVDEVIADVQAWFDDPAGFEAVIYGGSADDMPPFQVNADTRLPMSVRADDPEIKNALMHTVLAALATDPALSLDEAEQRDLLLHSGGGLLSDQDTLTGVRGNVGFIEQRIEDATARNAAELTSLDFAKSAFLAADPYETATNLENVQFQLQSLYQITGRMAQLSLGNFLR